MLFSDAIIAAACVNEAVKYLTFGSQNMNSYMMYMGTEGLHSHTFAYEQEANCPVCSSSVQKLEMSKSATLTELIQRLKDGNLRLGGPSLVSGSGKTLYMPRPQALEKATRPNLKRALSVLIDDGEELVVTDPVLGDMPVKLVVSFTD